MTTSGGGGLAEVIYFPGVTPPPDDATTPQQTPDPEPESVRAGEPEPELPRDPEPAAGPERGPADSVRAENIAMRALTRRGQSRSELEARLTARDLDPDTVHAELERLAGVGLIDDEALAEDIIRTSQQRKKLGRSAIIAELRRRRIDSDTIEVALGALDGAADSELERAIALAQQRAGRLGDLDRETTVRRLSGFLQRRGYAGDIVRQAVTRALEGQTGAVRFR